MAKPIYSIGQLAEAAGTKTDTIRYYERIGILPLPPRTEGNYRTYTKNYLDRLNFIRRGRAVGFSLEALKQLLAFSDNTRKSHNEIVDLVQTHLAEVDYKISELKTLRAQLRNLKPTSPRRSR